MNWCWYLGVNILGMSEEEFFRSTPKKLFKLAEIHQKMNASNEEKDEEKEEVFIDDLGF